MKVEIITEIPPTLKEAQDFVGGDIDILWIDNNTQMVVNADGIMFYLPINPEASRLAKRTIVGDVLILKGTAKLR